MLVCVVVSVALGVPVPVLGPLPDALRLIGIPVVAGGLWLAVANARRFELAGANIVTSLDPTAFVTDGAFRWSRNPMYLGFLLLATGVACGVGSLSAFVGPLVFFAAADRWYIPFEERRMSDVFGDEYQRYRSVVRRWVGRRSVSAT